MTTQPPDDERPYRVPRRRQRQFPAPLTEPLGQETPPREPPRDESPPRERPREETPPPPRRSPQRPTSSRQAAGRQAPAPPPRRRQRPPEPEPDPQFEEEAYDDYDDYEDEYGAYGYGYEPESPSLLRNPFLLAGLAMAGAIILAIFVVVLSSSRGDNGGGGNTSNNNNGNNGGGGSTGAVVLTPDPGSIIGTAIVTSTVREGPSSDYLEIGVLRRGQQVQVVGRNEDFSWLEVYFPPNSRLPGWVAVSALDASADEVAGLPLAQATPIDRPTVEIPTALPVETTTPEATNTPELSEGPDLAVAILNNNCTEGDPLNIVITNTGNADLEGRGVQVTIVTPNGSLGTLGFVIPLMQPGQSINIPTGQAVTAPRTTVQVDLVDPPLDVNSANNTVDCVVSQVPSETPTEEIVDATPTEVTP